MPAKSAALVGDYGNMREVLIEALIYPAMLLWMVGRLAQQRAF
jgi:hypothetical protein